MAPSPGCVPSSPRNNAATIKKDYAIAGMDPGGAIQPGVQARIDRVVKGLEDPPQPGSRAPGAAAILNGIAVQYPDADLMQLHQRNAAIKAFGEGKQGDSVRAFDTMIGHTEDLKQAALALQNGNFPILNAIANKYGMQTGQTPVQTFNTIRTAVGGEAAKAVTGSSAAEADRAKYMAPFSENLAPAQIAAAVDATQHLGAVQLDSLERQYQRTAGVKGIPLPTFDEKWLSPTSLAVKQRNASNAAPTTAPSAVSPNVVKTPDGVNHTFPNPAAAAAFKKAAGI